MWLKTTSLVAPLTYAEQWNVLVAVQQETTKENTYGIALLVTGVALPQQPRARGRPPPPAPPQAAPRLAQHLLYKRNGTYATESVKPYWAWGIVVTVMVVVLTFGLSGLAARSYAYELFLAGHVVFSAVLLAGCWYHVYDLQCMTLYYKGTVPCMTEHNKA
ncbi:hypothetical protein SCUCBS95973_007377 [Sporothrix curviconia]|uniref:Ferric oxidoreductase domain-containing protein n=1 Tax=Sporothrix curviconia TaxID=1260050 RepID=A0ABP0CDG7_9PEZI